MATALFGYFALMGLVLAYLWFYRRSRAEPPPKKERRKRPPTRYEALNHAKAHFRKLKVQARAMGLPPEAEAALLEEIDRRYWRYIDKYFN